MSKRISPSRIGTLSILALLAVLLIVAGTRDASAAGITNGGFETGDLTGWTAAPASGGHVIVVSTGFSAIPPAPSTPDEGSFYAELKSNGPGSFSTLSQTIKVAPGSTISGSAFFGNQEFSGPPCFFDDSAAVRILSGTSAIATVFAASSCTTASTPWTSWSHTFTAGGTFTVEARVANFADSIVDAYMGLDGVEFTLAPVDHYLSYKIKAPKVDKKVKNAGFEKGDLTDWTAAPAPIGGHVIVVSTGFSAIPPAPSTPDEGLFYAELKSNGPGSFSTLSQTISAAAGGTISGSAFFGDQEFGSCFFNDAGDVRILDAALVPVATVFSASSCSTGSTPWTTWSHTFASSGTFTVQARVTNTIDSIVDAYMGLDGLEITRPQVSLTDQFGSADYGVGKLERLLNPVVKDHAGAVTGIGRPDLHYTGYKLHKPKGTEKQPERTVVVQNQFGDIELITKQPKLLLVPANKNIGAPDLSLPPDSPPILANHYVCYDVKLPKGEKFPKGLQVELEDQFLHPGTKLFDVKGPKRLCNPVEKVHDGQTQEIVQPEDHLLCYKIKGAKGEPKHEPVLFHTGDQIGLNPELISKKEAELCLPSLKFHLGG